MADSPGMTLSGRTAAAVPAGNPKKILDYMEGFLVSKTLFTACELGVFDLLQGSQRPLSAVEISQTLGASLDGMQRLLAACVGMELLNAHCQDQEQGPGPGQDQGQGPGQDQGQGPGPGQDQDQGQGPGQDQGQGPGPGQDQDQGQGRGQEQQQDQGQGPGPGQDQGQVCYSNSEQAGVYLTRSSPLSLYHSIQYNSRTIYLCWHYLTDAVREGCNQYHKAFGVSSKDLFEALYRSDEEMLKFMQLMNSIWNICGRDVVTAFDLSPFRVIYDLGGCSGALAKQCTSAYPGCTVTIFDLPKVVQTAREHFVTEGERRIGFYEGDFFKDPLPEADLFILARILHDWTDERCIELLTRVHQSCKPGGGVLLVEALLREDGSGPLTAQLFSLNMLLQTEGRERTARHYTSLLGAAGFSQATVQVRYTGKTYDAVLGRKEA